MTCQHLQARIARTQKRLLEEQAFSKK